MAPGNNSNNNNALQRRVPFVITPEQFVENQRWIQRQVELLNDLNRRGVESYLIAQQSLQRRIADGDRARQQLEDLQRISNTRAVTERPIISTNDVSQYAGPSHLSNQRQPVLSPTNFVNPTNIIMNNQAAYTTNGTSVSNYTIGAQVPPLSPVQDYNYMFQQGSSRLANGEIYLNEPYPDVTQHQQQNSQTGYVRSRHTPSSIDPIQQVPQRQLANDQSRFRTSYAPSNVDGQRASGQTSIPQAIFQRIYARERSLPEPMRMSGVGSGRGRHVPAASTSSSLAGALGDYANAHLRGNASGYQLNMDQPLHLDSQTRRASEPRETQRTFPNQVQVPAGEGHVGRDSRLHEPVLGATLAQQPPLDASGYQSSRDQSLRFDPRTRDAREAGATQRTLPSQVQVQAGESHARRDNHLLETVLNTTLAQLQPIGTSGYQQNRDRSLQFDSQTEDAREAGETQRTFPNQAQVQAGEGHMRRDGRHHEPVFTSTITQQQPPPTVKGFPYLPPMSPEELLQRQNELDDIIKLQDQGETHPIKDTVSVDHGDDRADFRTEGPSQPIAENQNADSRSATSEYQGSPNVQSARNLHATGAETGSQQHVYNTAPPPSGTSSDNSVPPSSNAKLAAVASTVNPALLQQKIPVSLDPHISDTSKYFPSSEIKIPIPYSSATTHSDTSVHASPTTQTMQTPSDSNGQEDIRITTPPPHDNKPLMPITPNSANKKTLAKDILWALGITPAKRSTSEPSSTTSEDELQPPLKRQAVEPVTVMMQGLTDDPPVMAFESDPGSARIEEVPDSEAENDDNHQLAVSNRLAGYTTIDDHVELVPVSNSDTTGASDAPTHSDQPPPLSAIESHASSEDVMLVDTVLQHPPEDSSNPLFLPSPDSTQSSSSPPLAMRRTRRETSGPSSSPAQARKARKDVTQRSRVFVEVPKLTEEQRLLFFKRRTNPAVVQQRASRRETKSTVDVTAPVDEDTLKLAQQASELSSSRLRERPCLWIDCSHVANSAKTLTAHVQDHITLIPEKEKIFPCWWGECIRRFNKRDALAQHLQNHVKKSIYCPYEGCENQFAHQLELLAHIRNKHLVENNKLRLSTQLLRPSLRQNLPPLRTMLAYQAVDIPVQMARMSKERRDRLGPWVLKNCFGSVNLGGLKLNARNQPQGRRPGDVEQKVLGDWHDRYDFVEPDGATYPSNLADLESSKATQDIELGLLLAPDLVGPRGPLEEQLLTSRADRIKHDDSYIIKSERNSEEPEEPVTEIKEEGSDIEIDELRSSASPVMLVPGTPSQETSSVYQDFLGVGEPPVDEPSSL